MAIDAIVVAAVALRLMPAIRIERRGAASGASTGAVAGKGAAGGAG